MTEQRGKLETAVKHRRNIDVDAADLEKWLSSTERELDLREAKLEVDDVKKEIDFVQVDIVCRVCCLMLLL